MLILYIVINLKLYIDSCFKINKMVYLICSFINSI